MATDVRAVAAENERLRALLTAAEARAKELERERDRLVKAQRQPALLHQDAEEFYCSCGASGSGEGHAEWCSWRGSEWENWGNQFERAEAAESRATALAEEVSSG